MSKLGKVYKFEVLKGLVRQLQETYKVPTEYLNLYNFQIDNIKALEGTGRIVLSEFNAIKKQMDYDKRLFKRK